MPVRATLDSVPSAVGGDVNSVSSHVGQHPAKSPFCGFDFITIKIVCYTNLTLIIHVHVSSNPYMYL